MIELTITGHRPKDLSIWQLRELGPLAVQMVDTFKEYDPIWNVGGALGVDQTIHQVLINMEQHTILHSPGGPTRQGLMWSETQRRYLTSLMDASTQVCEYCLRMPMTSDSYGRDLNARNRCMSNRSMGTIAYWTGKPYGGTFNTIRYTLSQNKPVWNAFDGFKPITHI